MTFLIKWYIAFTIACVFAVFHDPLGGTLKSHARHREPDHNERQRPRPSDSLPYPLLIRCLWSPLFCSPSSPIQQAKPHVSLSSRLLDLTLKAPPTLSSPSEEQISAKTQKPTSSSPTASSISVEDLTSKSRYLEAELQRTSKKLKEVSAIAADEAEKCKSAKEVIKSLTAQVGNVLCSIFWSL